MPAPTPPPSPPPPSKSPAPPPPPGAPSSSPPPSSKPKPPPPTLPSASTNATKPKPPPPAPTQSAPSASPPPPPGVRTTAMRPSVATATKPPPPPGAPSAAATKRPPPPGTKAAATKRLSAIASTKPKPPPPPTAATSLKPPPPNLPPPPGATTTTKTPSVTTATKPKPPAPGAPSTASTKPKPPPPPPGAATSKPKPPAPVSAAAATKPKPPPPSATTTTTKPKPPAPPPTAGAPMPPGENTPVGSAKKKKNKPPPPPGAPSPTHLEEDRNRKVRAASLSLRAASRIVSSAGRASTMFASSGKPKPPPPPGSPTAPLSPSSNGTAKPPPPPGAPSSAPQRPPEPSGIAPSQRLGAAATKPKPKPPPPSLPPASPGALIAATSASTPPPPGPPPASAQVSERTAEKLRVASVEAALGPAPAADVKAAKKAKKKARAASMKELGLTKEEHKAMEKQKKKEAKSLAASTPTPVPTPASPPLPAAEAKPTESIAAQKSTAAEMKNADTAVGAGDTFSSRQHKLAGDTADKVSRRQKKKARAASMKALGMTKEEHKAMEKQKKKQVKKEKKRAASLLVGKSVPPPAVTPPPLVPPPAIAPPPLIATAPSPPTIPPPAGPPPPLLPESSAGSSSATPLAPPPSDVAATNYVNVMLGASIKLPLESVAEEEEETEEGGATTGWSGGPPDDPHPDAAEEEVMLGPPPEDDDFLAPLGPPAAAKALPSKKIDPKPTPAPKTLPPPVPRVGEHRMPAALAPLVPLSDAKRLETTAKTSSSIDPLASLEAMFGATAALAPAAAPRTVAASATASPPEAWISPPLSPAPLPFPTSVSAAGAPAAAEYGELVDLHRSSRYAEIDEARERVRTERRNSTSTDASAERDRSILSRADRVDLARRRQLLEQARRLFAPPSPTYLRQLNAQLRQNAIRGTELVRHGPFVYAAEQSLQGPVAVVEARARFLSDVFTTYEEDDAAEVELLVAGFALLGRDVDAVDETCDALIETYDVAGAGTIPILDVVECLFGMLVFKHALHLDAHGSEEEIVISKSKMRAEATSIARAASSSGVGLNYDAFRVLLIAQIEDISPADALTREIKRREETRHAEAVRIAANARDAVTQHRFASAHQHLAALAAGSAASAADAAALDARRHVAPQQAPGTSDSGPLPDAALLAKRERRARALEGKAAARRHAQEVRMDQEREQQLRRIVGRGATVESYGALDNSIAREQQAFEERRAANRAYEQTLNDSSYLVSQSNPSSPTGIPSSLESRVLSPPALNEMLRPQSPTPPISARVLAVATKSSPVVTVVWYYRNGAHEVGPQLTSSLSQLIKDGSICETTAVWRTGWSKWETAAGVGRLATLIVNAQRSRVDVGPRSYSYSPTSRNERRSPTYHRSASPDNAQRTSAPRPYASLSSPVRIKSAHAQRTHSPNRASPLPLRVGRGVASISRSRSPQEALPPAASRDGGTSSLSPHDRRVQQRGLDEALTRFKSSPVDRSVGNVDAYRGRSPPSRGRAERVSPRRSRSPPSRPGPQSALHWRMPPLSQNAGILVGGTLIHPPPLSGGTQSPMMRRPPSADPIDAWAQMRARQHLKY